MDAALMLHRLVLAILALSLVAARPLGAELLPHRAIYRMSLAPNEPSNDVAAADGIMLYQFARGCDGWTVENKTVLRLGYENEATTQTVWTFVSWESLDGHHFRFRARYEQDGQKLEKLAGQADLGDEGKGGEAVFDEPQGLRIALPAGTVFPTSHMREVLAAAADQHTPQHTLARVVFDGASVDNPYQVNALFGPLPAAAAEELAKAAGLPVLPAWWTRMAFFPLASQAALPEFEIDAQYRADGVADRIRQSFERFAVDVRLQNLQVLPKPEC
jgi:EipB-like